MLGCVVAHKPWGLSTRLRLGGGVCPSEGGGSGCNVFKHTFIKNADGALDVTVQMVGHYRTFFFPWTYEELNDARFAPKR